MSQPNTKEWLEDALERYLEKDVTIQERSHILEMVKEIYGEKEAKYMMAERAKLYPPMTRGYQFANDNNPVGFDEQGEIDSFNFPEKLLNN